MGKGVIIAVIVLLILSGIVLLAIYYNNDAGKNGFCFQDDECVPAEACHPKTCILKEKSSDSSGMICTAVCEPGSLDCGQGSCQCINKRCEAVIE